MSRPSRGRLRLAAAGLCIGGLLGATVVGGEAAWAHFTASAQGTGEVTSPAVSIDQVNFENLSHTYTNTLASLEQTGSFNVANTGNVAGAVSVSISGPGFLSSVPIRVWPVASAADCTSFATAPASAIAGTWAATTLVRDRMMKPGENTTYCVRSDGGVQKRISLASTSGSQSAQTTLSASLSASGWTARDTTGVNTQSTRSIYPLATSYLPVNQSHWFTVRSAADTTTCLDVSGQAGTPGAALTAGRCTDSASQRWQFLPVESGNQTRVSLVARHAPVMRATAAADAQRLGSASGAADTRWFVQQISSTRYLLVSQVDGKCLSVPSAVSGTTRTVDCTDASAVLELRREGLSIRGNDDGLVLEFGASFGPQQLQVQYRDSPQSSWTTVATSGLNSSSVTAQGARFPLDRAVPVRLIYQNGVVAYDGLTFETTRDKPWWSLTWRYNTVVTGIG